MLAFLLLLNFSMIASGEANSDVFAAPQLTPRTADLEMVLSAPEEAHCADSAGVDLGVGTWVPRHTGEALRDRLAECYTLPYRCQARIDAAKVLMEPAPGWPTWAVVVVSAGAIILGGLAGYGAARITR